MIENTKNIYFVENIISELAINDEDTDKVILVLLKASEKSNLLSVNENFDFHLVEMTKDRLDNVSEGKYVYYLNGRISNAGNTSISRRHIYYNNLFRGRLLKNLREKREELEINKNAKIYSYHINVGHGNCSIIVIRNVDAVKIWMIDCSDYDYHNKCSYRCNIDACKNHISKKFGISEVRISKLFLTHPHFDHYSGIERLIDHGVVSGQTEFYLNLHYSMPSEIFNRLLRKIVMLRPTIIEPISSFNANNIEVWHPHELTIRSYSRKYAQYNYNVESNPNNASAVYYLRFGEKAILFPGDIETKKWDTIIRCPMHLKGSDYFVISHHGSLNGHIRNNCPHKRTISNLSNCVGPCSTQILMGRDKAYHGIYSDQVINDFKNIVYSEKDYNSRACKFLEIDWQINQNTWF